MNIAEARKSNVPLPHFPIGQRKSISSNIEPAMSFPCLLQKFIRHSFLSRALWRSNHLCRASR